MSDHQGSLRVYCAGGCGINIMTEFLQEFTASSDSTGGVANVLPAYIDTSDSNLSSDIAEDQVYLLKNAHGSGKLRKENHQELAKVTKQILHQLPPGDLNVVLFSASGGSGAVAGAQILGELLNRQLPVVALVVGSTESFITTENTYKTLQTLSLQAERKALPVVMYYDQNGHEHGRREVNQGMVIILYALALLASNQNHGLDLMDITHWTQFSKVTSVAPQLAQLEVYQRGDDVSRIQDPIAVASLYTRDYNEDQPLSPEYHCEGKMVDGENTPSTIDLVITLDAVPTLFDNLKKLLEQYETQRNSRVQRTAVVGDDDNVTDDDLVI